MKPLARKNNKKKKNIILNIPHLSVNVDELIPQISKGLLYKYIENVVNQQIQNIENEIVREQLYMRSDIFSQKEKKSQIGYIKTLKNIKKHKQLALKLFKNFVKTENKYE